jgi:membrane-bound metal-dependent hydrolase YbcI (DUF457 family)
MVFSASMYLVTAPLVSDYITHQPVTGGTLVAGAVVAAGAGLIADLDTPKSRASTALGPITGTISKGVAIISGGHRYGTHALIAVVGVWFAMLKFIGAWGDSLPVMLTLTTLLISFAVRELIGERISWLFVLAVALAGGITCLAISPSYVWLHWAIVVGYALHLAADSLTTEGVRLLWPLSNRSFGLKAFDSDSAPARLVTAGAAGFMILLLLVQLVMPALASNHPELVQQSQILQKLVAYGDTQP